MTNPEVHTIDPVHPDKALIEKAARLLKAGRLVVAPTETRYGLLASADNAEAVQRVCRVKARGVEHAIAVFVNTRSDLEKCAELPRHAVPLVEAFMPGPLTLVASARVDWPAPLVVDGRIGIRWSSSPVVAALVEATGVPLTATSANLSGRPERDSVEEIVEDLGEHVALYLDVGPLTGKPSTVVACDSVGVHLLRKGAINESELEVELVRATRKG